MDGNTIVFGETYKNKTLFRERCRKLRALGFEIITYNALTYCEIILERRTTRVFLKYAGRGKFNTDNSFYKEV